ncbi:MAG: GFA family protein [Gammaproteobacteria bacterium]|nr:GFA family protein [Gammaproteobacteria bacterium]
MISGRCECGRVRYEVDGAIVDFSHCHCSQCRRLHGAAYATFAGVLRKNFRYVSGEEDVRVYASSEKNDRVFCGICGSAILVASSQYPDYLYLSMSTVQGDPPRPEGYHQYVSSKAPWHEITDGLKQYAVEPPD